MTPTKKTSGIELGALSAVALGVSVAGIVGAAGLAGSALAAQDGAAQDAQQACVTAGEAGTRQEASRQVRVSSVQGTFAFTQAEITPTAQIARALGGADKVLCGASQEALPTAQEVVADAADWQITVGGDGVQTASTLTLGQLAQTGSQSTVMGCSCLGNPADGRATVNAAVTGVPVLDLPVAAGGVSEGANAITFVSSDGYEVTPPLFYVLQRASMIVYQLNGEPLSSSVGGTNQLWLGSTAARYFASDVVEIRVTCEEEAPAVPGTPDSGDHAANLPNASVTQGQAA